MLCLPSKVIGSRQAVYSSRPNYSIPSYVKFAFAMVVSSDKCYRNIISCLNMVQLPMQCGHHAFYDSGVL